MKARIALAALLFLMALFSVVVVRALVLFYEQLWNGF